MGVVAVLLCAYLLAHGALLLAREERAVASAGLTLLETRARARARVADTAAALLPDPAAPLWVAGPAARVEGPEGWSDLTVVRLGGEWWWVESAAGAPAGPGAGRAGTALWALDPATRIAGARTVVEVAAGASISGAERIGGESWRDRSGRSARACRPWLAAATGAWRLAPLGERGAGVEPSLGLLTLDRLLAAAGTDASGSWSPEPVRAGGRCVPGATNWGAPSDPLGPCGDRHVLRVASGDVRLSGGEGQGVLAVAGALTLEAGARFDGVILVAGRLVLASSARVRGLVIAGPEVSVSGNAGIEASACAAGNALAGLREELGRGVWAIRPRWIGPLLPGPRP